MKVFIAPSFNSVDRGDGGIRRVVDAQRKYLPEFGIEIVKLPEQADVVATHAGSWVQTDKPTVSHCHGLYWDGYEWQNWHRALNKDVIYAMRRADVVTATSEWVADVIRRGSWISPHVLYHGVNLDEWEPGNNLNYVLWNKTRVDAICTPYELNELAKLAPTNKFVSTFADPASNVRITGTLPYDESKELIRNAGVYLCTARETFGIGTLEAMACGVPILGWDWGGQSEFVVHKQHGWLARPGDFESLREGLNYCLANRKMLGDNARALVQGQFTWKHAIERYVPVYESLFAQPSRPKVSVIIPCYNLQQYLPRALASVVNGDIHEKHIEIIVVDDASDEPVVVPAEFAGKVRVIRNETNQYLAETLNVGIAASSGEYIIPLDADNELGPRAIEILSQQLDNHRDVDIVYGAVEFVEENGKRFVSGWPPKQFSFDSQMAHRNQMPSTSMYRRRVWEQSGGYRRRCRTAEDADFWTRVTSLGFVPHYATDAVTLIYYNRGDSMSHVQKDWDWTAWYPWSRDKSLTPFIAVQNENQRVVINEPVGISVVIPVGPGHERYVIDAIDSLVAQSFNRWEAIVVNDTGSPLPWIHPFVRVIDTSGKVGQAKARNIGIAAAKAKLFVCLDADDYLAPSALQRMYDVQQEVGGYVYTDWLVAETLKVETTAEFNCNNLKQHMPHAVTALYPKEAWSKVGGFDEDTNAWEDWMFLLALCREGYCGTRIAKPLFYYRVSTGSVRETMYANKDELKKEVFEKFIDVIGDKSMACGGCSKGGGVISQPATASAKVAMPSVTNDMVLLEYTSKQEGNRSFRGKVTNTVYRFGTDNEHKIRYVARLDAEELLRLPTFKVAEVKNNDAVLVAAGPPR